MANDLRVGIVGDVDDTLIQLLKDELAKNMGETIEVTLLPPEEGISDDTPRINLFLYQVAINTHVNNQSWVPSKTDPNELRYPPLCLNLFYLLTPYASEKKDEHRILGETMRIMNDHSIVEESFFQGSLVDSGAHIKLVFNPLPLEELTQFWNSLSQPYHLSVCYEVRLIPIESTKTREVKRVFEKEMRYYEKTK